MRINLSGKQFRQRNLDDEITRMLQETNLSADRLHLEMSEKVIMEQVRLTNTTLSGLQARGVQLCIDDFGTGYASLSYLHYFPIHSLKIDGSFVGRIGAGDKSTEIVRTIVALARNLGMEVIAEGVETREQEIAIREMGCDYAQGFFYSNPLDSAEVADLLANYGTSARNKAVG
jgi:EAL domain-containing protein (putative c-di-GMP-specific phosphodiesterase class I)